MSIPGVSVNFDFILTGKAGLTYIGNVSINNVSINIKGRAEIIIVFCPSANIYLSYFNSLIRSGGGVLSIDIRCLCTIAIHIARFNSTV